MKYLALLRGINVGGKNKVDMRTLKATFEKAGMSEITTYINSGNVIFNDGRRKPPRIAAVLEEAIAADFGLPIKVLIRDLPAIKKVIKALPDTWTTDTTMRCDVMFFVGRFRSEGHPAGTEDQTRDRRRDLCAGGDHLAGRSLQYHQERNDETGRHRRLQGNDDPQQQHSPQAGRDDDRRGLQALKVT